jgi:hypothetical protein
MISRGLVRRTNPGRHATGLARPVERPATFEFVINLKTAEKLTLSLPQSLLVRTDHIIQ